jgi:hypothetical protein
MKSAPRFSTVVIGARELAAQYKGIKSRIVIGVVLGETGKLERVEAEFEMDVIRVRDHEEVADW